VQKEAKTHKRAKSEKAYKKLRGGTLVKRAKRR
jgi:hypothetical protein